MNRLVLLFAILVLLTGTSCTLTYGNKEVIDPAVEAQLLSRKVDKKEVRQGMGQPSDVLQQGGKTEWVYRYREAKNNWIGAIPIYGFNLFFGGRNGDVHTRKLYFDNNGRYVNGSYLQEPCYTSNFFSLGRTISNGFVDRDSQVRTKAEMEQLGLPFDKDKSSENQLLERAL